LGAVDGLDGMERGYLGLWFVGNPKTIKGWIEADVPLLGDLGAEADEPMVGPLVGKIVEPIVEMEEQVIAQVIDMEGDIAMLFGDGDFSDDDSEGFEDGEEVWEVYEEWLMAPVNTTPVPVVPPTEHLGGRRHPSCYCRDSLSPSQHLDFMCLDGVSDVEVADGITIREIGPRVFAIEGKVQVMTSQMVQAEDGLEQVQALQAVVQQRNSQIQQLQTMVSEMSSRERKLMQCILGMDRRLADLQRRPSGPQ
ncbi:hypothetical protein Tco_0737602, partial [Tanacetum coccineum]